MRVGRGALCVALAVCLGTFAVKELVLWPVQITGESMLPTYTDGQPNYINKLAYICNRPLRGDVIGLRVNNGEVYIKRIIGLPGEKVEFDRGKVVINGRTLSEPYLDPEYQLIWMLPSFQLGPDEYFVMGDNRRVSVLGPITADKIIGRALF